MKTFALRKKIAPMMLSLSVVIGLTIFYTNQAQAYHCNQGLEGEVNCNKSCKSTCYKDTDQNKGPLWCCNDD